MSRQGQEIVLTGDIDFIDSPSAAARPRYNALQVLDVIPVSISTRPGKSCGVTLDRSPVVGARSCRGRHASVEMWSANETWSIWGRLHYHGAVSVTRPRSCLFSHCVLSALHHIIIITHMPSGDRHVLWYDNVYASLFTLSRLHALKQDTV